MIGPGAVVFMFFMIALGFAFVSGLAAGNVMRARWDFKMLKGREELFKRQQAIVDGLFRSREKLIREKRLLEWQLHGGIDGDENLEALNQAPDFDPKTGFDAPESWTAARSRLFLAQVENFLRDTEDDD